MADSRLHRHSLLGLYFADDGAKGQPFSLNWKWLMQQACPIGAVMLAGGTDCHLKKAFRLVLEKDLIGLANARM